MTAGVTRERVGTVACANEYVRSEQHGVPGPAMLRGAGLLRKGRVELPANLGIAG
jgi:hypothetical protein